MEFFLSPEPAEQQKVQGCQREDPCSSQEGCLLRALSVAKKLLLQKWRSQRAPERIVWRGRGWAGCAWGGFLEQGLRFHGRSVLEIHGTGSTRGTLMAFKSFLCRRSSSTGSWLTEEPLSTAAPLKSGIVPHCPCGDPPCIRLLTLGCGSRSACLWCLQGRVRLSALAAQTTAMVHGITGSQDHGITINHGITGS